jgi:predicted secreted hydrolase
LQYRQIAEGFKETLLEKAIFVGHDEMHHQKPSDHKKTYTYEYLEACAIEPRDDAFHGIINLTDVEWWYFDAIFDNGYSLHVGFRVYQMRNSGFLQMRINIYQDGNVKVEKFLMRLLPDVDLSPSVPRISLMNKPVAFLDIEHYKQTGKWRYLLQLTIDDVTVDLCFDGTTPGWKIETSSTCWTTALPKATVKGTISLGNGILQVKGIGYHDHNWGYSASTMFSNIGWFWGRITGKNLNLTWAKTMKTPTKGDLLAILNRDSGENTQAAYQSMNPKDILLKVEALMKNHGRWIPSVFSLKTRQSSQGIDRSLSVNIEMNTIDVQHTRIFFAHYWRYHIETSGILQFGSQQEELRGKHQIIEFLSFKSPSPSLFLSP